MIGGGDNGGKLTAIGSGCLSWSRDACASLKALGGLVVTPTCDTKMLMAAVDCPALPIIPVMA